MFLQGSSMPTFTLADSSDVSSWGEAASQGGIALVFVLFLVGIGLYFLPWLAAKDDKFVAALKGVTEAHERANERHTKAIEHVAAAVDGIKVEVGRLRDEIVERDRT